MQLPFRSQWPTLPTYCSAPGYGRKGAAKMYQLSESYWKRGELALEVKDVCFNNFILAFIHFNDIRAESSFQFCTMLTQNKNCGIFVVKHQMLIT